MKSKYSTGSKVLTIFFVALSLLWIIPIFEVLNNSFKANTFVNLDAFALPDGESFMGLGNYIEGLTFGNYPFLKSAFYSVFISVVSTVLFQAAFLKKSTKMMADN